MNNSTTMLSVSGGVASFFVFILDIIIISEVINSSRTISGKLGWSFLVFLFPVFGAIMYFVFASRELYSSSYNRISIEDTV